MAIFDLHQNTKKIKTVPYYGLVLLAVISRLVPHIPNFTAVGASAIYSGRYLKGYLRFVVPVLAMFATDLFLGFHKTIIFVYLCFIFNVFLGIWVNKKPSLKRIALATVTGSVMFFLVTNFGVWLVGGIYPKSLPGFYACYINALPFARNTILGDIAFISVLFGTTAIINRYQQRVWCKKGEQLWQV